MWSRKTENGLALQCETLRRKCCLHPGYCRSFSVPESLLEADVRGAENSCHRPFYTRPVCRWFPSRCLRNVESELSALQLLDLSFRPIQRESGNLHLEDGWKTELSVVTRSFVLRVHYTGQPSHEPAYEGDSNNRKQHQVTSSRKIRKLGAKRDLERAEARLSA